MIIMRDESLKQLTYSQKGERIDTTITALNNNLTDILDDDLNDDMFSVLTLLRTLTYVCNQTLEKMMNTLFHQSGALEITYDQQSAKHALLLKDLEMINSTYPNSDIQHKPFIEQLIRRLIAE